MADTMYIDGVDALSTYGAYPLGYEGLLTWAEFKPIQTTEWDDEDEIDADLSNPQLDAHQFSLNVAVRDNMLEEFMEFIYSLHSHTFYFPTIELTQKLRVVGCSDMETSRTLGIVTLTLSEDMPMSGYEYTPPTSSIKQTHLTHKFLIDGKDITEYGCALLEGSSDSLRAYPDIKEVLQISASNQSGIIVDNKAPVRASSRQVTISLLMRASSIEEFWRNYNALYYDITRQDARQLDLVDTLFVEGYYKSMSVDYFSPPRFKGDKVWLKFSVIFQTTPMSYYSLLVSEEAELIYSENLQVNIAVQ